MRRLWNHPALIGAWVFGATLSTALASPGALLESDADGRVHSAPQFERPVYLTPAIRFWRDIFTVHDSKTVVLHDKQQLDVVWEVLELPLNEDAKVDEKAARNLVAERTDELRSRLCRLERSVTPTDDEDAVILALAGHDIHRLVGACERIRSQRGVADKFREGLVRSRKWLGDIQRILREEGVPEEIAALPFIESMFNPYARSSVGAAGLWQLMPRTARELGLTVNQQRDDRMDIEKATRAAARMLRQNHRMLGAWPLAITGYNHGPYGVRRAVAQVGSTDIVDLIQQYETSSWGFSSKNFYAEFLAVLSILQEMPPQSAVASSDAADAEPHQAVEN